MHGGVVLISSSFSPILKQFVNTGDLSSHLFPKVVGLSILEDEFSIEKLLIDEARSEEAGTNDEDFCRCKSRCFGFGGFYFFEELVEDPHQRLEISRSEDLCHEVSTLSQEGTC